MKVRCDLTLLEKRMRGDGTEVYHELESFYSSIATHARLDLFSLEDEDKELIKSSEVFKWNEPCNKDSRLQINLHFSGFTWCYNCFSGDIMLYNRDFKI